MKRFYLNMAAFCVLFWSLYGCSVDGETGMPFPTPTPVAPELLSMRVVSGTEVDFEFSVPVRVLYLSFEPSLEIALIEEGLTVKVHLEQSLEPGMQIIAAIRAEDVHGNTFNENVPFEKENTSLETEEPYPEKEGPTPETERPSHEQEDPTPETDAPSHEQENSTPGTEGSDQEQKNPAPDTEGPSHEQEDPTPETDAPSHDPGDPETEAPSDIPGEEAGRNGAPELSINELRTESSGNRVEFVEFRMFSAGNLGGLRVFIYRSGARTPTEFEFPSLEVKEGEFAVLYLRTPENINADSSPTAHNFWIPGSSSRLNKTSAIYVLDRYDMVLGAVMLSESPDPSWWEGSGRAHFADIAEFLFEQNAWKSPSGGIATPASAVITSSVGTAVTRSISRDELVDNTNTAADWYITANNGATPGMPNDSRRL